MKPKSKTKKISGPALIPGNRKGQDKPSPPQPLRSGYNPQTAKHGLAAKLWELLRRNPYFRVTARDLQRANPLDTHDYDLLRERFRIVDEQSPFAGFALRWLFRPKFLEFYFPRQPHDFFKPWTAKDWAESGFPWLSEEKLFELEGILNEENKGESYPGPLTLSAGPFTLETPWPETPELFQFLFGWMWEEYQFDRLSDSEAAKLITVGKLDDKDLKIDWNFMDSEAPRLDWETLYNLRRLKFVIEHHDLFVIPRLMLTGEQKKNLSDKFKQQMLENRGFVHVLKYPHFLGNEMDWLVFDFCRAGIAYEKDPEKPDQPPARTGSGKSFNNLIEQQQKKGKWNSAMETHVERSYKKMESLMCAVFPSFDFGRLIEVDLEIGSRKAVVTMSKLALQGTREKLRGLHEFVVKFKPSG
jgi:hypothetical protein